ncbi:ice-binding family protein [Geopsychrobacter electrodiphilus]|uniref:ice-binding family protein n=1 Tax=Geopsychrobacter electrodiphilus TaxID=225196 RepID=UPI00037FFA7C|nr:ice-binding family protein [Geopsychrobacter electrodiphilus]
MKRLRMLKTCLGFGLLLSIFLLSGCGGDAGVGVWDAPTNNTNKLLTSISVTPAASFVPINGIRQFTATASYDDGSTGDVTASSSWTSSTPAIATVGTIAPTTGLATGLTSGVSDITASFGGQTATATLTVATLTSLQVTPVSASVTLGGTRQYTARATYSDASIHIVTSDPATVWNSSIPGVATISANGLATGVADGTSNITATFGGLTSAAVTLNVDATLPLIIIPGAVCTVDSGPTIPTVTMSDPTSDNLLVKTSTAGVANNGKLITATFSLAMDPTTITAPPTFTIMETVSLNSVAGSVTMDATNKIATFTTDAALLPDTDYTASISTAAMSADAIAISCPYEWDFTTATNVATGVGSVNFGAAATFGSASTAGIVNVGATTVNGDVVLDPDFTCNGVTVGSAGLIGQCNGIAPTINGDVISPLYPDAGVTSGKIVADLRAAYIALSPAQMSTGVTTIADGTTLGAGAGTAAVLNDNLFFPGIYKTTSGGMLITGDLTLDGQGDSDAVFVFQSDSSIGTAATGAADPHTRILLTNGAKASNVYWWVGSNQATLGSHTIFQGNILSYSSITMETGASSCGRLFAGASTDGAFTFGDNIVSVPGNVNAPAGCK